MLGGPALAQGELVPPYQDSKPLRNLIANGKSPDPSLADLPELSRLPAPYGLLFRRSG